LVGERSLKHFIDVNQFAYGCARLNLLLKEMLRLQKPLRFLQNLSSLSPRHNPVSVVAHIIDTNWFVAQFLFDMSHKLVCDQYMSLKMHCAPLQCSAAPGSPRWRHGGRCRARTPGGCLRFSADSVSFGPWASGYWQSPQNPSF